MNKLIPLMFLLIFAGAAFAVECYGDNGAYGALHWWTMDDADRAGGVTYDVCGYDTNGTEDEVSTGQTGVFGESYELTSPGTNTDTADGVYNTNEMQFTGNQDFSNCIWFKMDSTPGVQGNLIFGSTGSTPRMTAQLNTLDQVKGVARDTTHALTAESTGGYNNGTFQFLCYTYNGTSDHTLAVYINATLVASGTELNVDTNLYGGADDMGVGYLKSGGGTHVYGFDGWLDEAQWYNYTLTQAEIANLTAYNNITGVAPAPPPPPWNYTVLSSTFTTPEYETNNTAFNFTIATNTTTINSVIGNLSWNGTIFSPTSTGNTTVGTNNTYWFAYDNFGIPLVTTNYTNISQLWTYNMSWVNGTQTNHTDTTNTQAIFFNFYWGDYAPDLSLFEGHSFDMDATFTEGNAGVVWNVTAVFNNTVYELTGGSGVYTDSAIAPDITGENETFVSNATFYLNFTGEVGGQKLYNRTSENETMTVFAPALVNCTLGGSQPTINFSFYTENNLTALPSDMDATFTWWTHANHSGYEYTGNFSISNVIELSLCIYPNITLYVDSFQVYSDNGSSYRTRNYFLNNATLTNTTAAEIDLYNILTADSSLLTLTIVDDLVAQEGDFVSMERYYPGENLYRTVEIGMTDEDGVTFLYPVPNDVYYRFIVVRNYTTVYSGDPREIGISSFTIDTGGELTLEYFDYQGISVSCSKAGNIIGCSLINPSGLDVGAALLVREIGIYSDTEICYQTAPSVATTTLLCNVSGYSGIIQADLMFIAPESLLSAWTETYNGTGTDVFGALGLFIGVLIITGSGLLLGYSPGLSIIGALLGLIISVATGVVALSVTSVILMVVAGAFLIVKVRT